MNVKHIIIILVSCFLPVFSYSQLNVVNNMTPQQLVQNVLVGNGVSASNVTYTGATVSIGYFSNGNSTNLGMDEGILLSTGNVLDAIGPNNAPNKSTNTLGGSDPQLDSLVSGFSVFDAAVLEFDFVPMSDSIKLEFSFASEEYPEWVGSLYNDVFGFFITGTNPLGGAYTNQNIALIPGTTLPITVNTLNNGPFNSGPCTNCSNYVNNAGGLSIQYDGFTVVLRACIPVVPCQSYHLKIAIGDAGDHAYDSGIFLKAGSFKSNKVNPSLSYSNPLLNSAYEGCSDAIVSFKLCYPTSNQKTFHYSLFGTASNGVDFPTIADSVVFAPNTDSAGYIISPVIDGINEGTENLVFVMTTSPCSIDTLVVHIADYNPVDVNITGTSAICLGDSFSLNALVSDGAPPFNFLWNNSQTQQTITQSALSTTNYIVNVTDFCGYSATDTHLINVVQPPNVGLQANKYAICPGDTITLSASGANSYQWTPSQPVNDSIIFITPVTSGNYTVKGFNSFGCFDTTSVEIVVNPLPTVNLSALNSNICIGDTTVITATGGGNYLWKANCNYQTISSNQISAFPDTTCSYKVLITNVFGCVDSSTIQVGVHYPQPLVVIPSYIGHCQGDSSYFTVSGYSNYSWTPTGTINNLSGNSFYASANVSTNYVFQGVDQYGCSAKDTLFETVFPNAQITVNPNDTTACIGQAVGLTASGGVNYFWSPSSGLNATVGASVIANPTITKQYIVMGIDSNGCTDTATVKIRRPDLPVITPTTSTICDGDTVLISVAYTDPASTFLWNNSSTASSILASPSSTTTYSVTVVDSKGCQYVLSSTITVLPQPTLTLQTANSGVCLGDTLNLIVSGATTYQWLPASGLLNSSGASANVSPNVTTVYQVIGSVPLGCSDTLDIPVSVYSLPTISVSPDSSTVCSAKPVSLTASGGTTYNWNYSPYLSSTMGQTVVSTSGVDVMQIVIGTDTNGCSGSDTAFIYVSPKVNITAYPPSICYGDSSVLSVNFQPGLTYQWSTGSSQSSVVVKPMTTQTYYVNAIDWAGCTAVDSIEVQVDSLPNITLTPANPFICEGDLLVLKAHGALNYQWVQGNGMLAFAADSAVVSPTSYTIYGVVGNNSQGCFDTVYTGVQVLAKPIVNITPNLDTICEGETISLAASGAATYSWTPSTGLSGNAGSNVIANPSATTNYLITGTALNGCTDDATATIVVNPKPQLVANQTLFQLCEGDSTLVVVNGADNYLWSPASGLSAIDTSTVYAKPSNTTLYHVFGENTFGCFDTLSIDVQVAPYPVVSVNPASHHLCPGNSTSITASGATNYVWTPASGLNTTNQASVIASPNQSTVYQVIGSNSFGCADTAFSTIDVSPVISILPQSPAICHGDSVELTVNSNSPNTLFVWSTGDTASSIWAKPSTSTLYTVTGYDSTGCSQTVWKQVVVNSLAHIVLNPPNPVICAGDTVNLSLTGAAAYNWSPAAGIQSTTGANNKAFPTATTSYQVVGQTSVGCIDTLDFQVKVNPLPNVVTQISEDTICKGWNTSLVASGATNYLWTPASSLNNTTNDSVIASPIVNTTYTVQGIDSNGCSNIAYAAVKVYNNPSIGSSAIGICPGDSAVLTTTTTLPYDSILWSTGASTSTIMVWPANTTTYTTTAYYSKGCSYSTQKILTVYHDPDVVGSANDFSICFGDTATLLGQNSVIYQWYSSNNTLLNNSGSTVLANPTVSESYVVKGFSTHGCESSDTVTITVHSLPTIIASAADTFACENDTNSLFGIGGTSYFWSPANVLNQTTGSHVIATISTPTDFVLVGIDQHGCVGRDTLSLTVDYGPSVYITPVNPIVCQGDTGLLTGHGAVSYSWSPAYAIAYTNNQFAHISPLSNTIFTMRGYNANGCYSDTSVYVNVKRNPVMHVFPALDSICEGDSILITAMGAGMNATYNWIPSTGLNNPVGDSVWASPMANTTYTITGISTDGCSKTISSEIKVNVNPSVSLWASKSQLCVNDTVDLAASGFASYQWSTNGTILGFTGDSLSHQPNSTTLYKIVATNQHGCSDSASQQVTVHNLPNIQIQASDTILCDGDSAYLTPSGGVTYSWSGTTTLFPFGTNTQYIKPNSNSSVFLLGTDTNGCKNRDTISVSVMPSPTVFASASPAHICAGDSVFLNSWSTSSPVTFIWSTGDTANSLSENPLATNVYSVKGVNQYGCYDSVGVLVVVNPIPTITMIPTDTIICLNDSVLLKGVTGLAGINYSWNIGGGQLTGLGSSVMVGPSAITQYTLIATDSLGCSDTATTNVGVQPKPVVSITSSKPEICFGDSVIFSSIATPLVTYLWSTGQMTSSVNQSPSASGWYSLIVTDSIGCQGDDSLWLKVNPLPQFSVNPAQSVICIGDSVNINAGSTVGNYSYSWSTGPTTSSIVVNPNASSTYTVTATDTLGCFDSLQSIVTVNPLPQLEILPLDAKLCLGDTMILSVNSNPAAQSVSWSGGGTGIQKQVWPTVNTIYTVSVTDVNNCHNTTSREVKVFNKPIITILPEIDSICNGDSIQHQVFSTNPIFSILWNTMDTTDIITTIPPITRVYSAFVIDTNGCWGTDSAEVVVKHRPQVNILPEQLWSCTADSLMIACLTTAAPGSLHVWDFDGGNILSGSGTNPHWLKWTNPGSYIVTLFAEQNGCFSKTDTAIIDVFETPVVDFIADPTAACENVNVQFQNLTANIQHYHWNFGNPLVQDDTSNLENPTYAYPQPGTYGIRLQVVSNDGCKAEDFKPAYVIVSPNPVADFEGFPKEVSILDPKISFWDFSIDALTWEYDFDDPNSGSSNFANIKYPWHNFTDTGYYDVQLVVTNEYGCTDTAYRTFYVKPFPQLYFPDAFTPNGDGLNDVFQVVGHDFDWNTFEMNILDRWGRVLFRTTDVNEGWNGKEFNTGNMCPPANYVVVIKVSDRDKNPEVFRGRVVLVR